MMAIWSFILGNKTLIAMGILAAVIAGQYAYITLIKSQKEVLVSEVAKSKVLLGVSQASVAQLRLDIEFQNKEVQKFKTFADDRAKENAQIKKDATLEAIKLKKQSTDLLKRMAPEGVDMCTAADMLMREEIEKARQD